MRDGNIVMLSLRTLLFKIGRECRTPNDEAGRTRTQDIIKHLEGSGKTVEDRPPPIGKDYNDTLVQVTQEYQKHCISLDDILEETR